MTDHTEDMRKVVRAEIDRQRKDAGASSQRGKVLGAFVDAALTTAGRSRADLAKKLPMEPELLDAICDGLLPESEIDDAVLADLARAIDFKPNVLRALLGRAVVPGGEGDAAQKSS